MDTPRTNLGDATYLSRAPPDFDMTQESSFHSPSKDNNIVQQLRNGRGVNLRTPRGNSRAPLGDKRNLPAGIAGAEFTPMLKSATRNSARRFGKENTNGVSTPTLSKINEDIDMTNIPVETSLYGPSRGESYVESTPLPQVENSSAASTPLAVLPRRGGNKGPLQDGNQLSLREQENVIDRIEKENFGLKLKIHFLEEALRKTGPGFSEAALKENTELKVDKVTMQRDLHKYKKHLAAAEKDLETYQQQILEVQEKAKKKYADQNQRAEIEALRRSLEDKDAEIENLQRQLQRGSKDQGTIDQLHDEIGDLEADIRQKDREINEREEEVDGLKNRLEEVEENWRSAQNKIADLEAQAQSPEDLGKLEELQDKIRDLEADLREKDMEINDRDEELNELEEKLGQAEEKWKSAQERVVELQENARSSEELDEAKGTIGDLESDVQQLEQQLNDMKEQLEAAISDKDRAEADLEELQEEMSNKSLVTKGLSRQVEEKVTRLQTEVSRWQEKYEALEQGVAEKDRFSTEVKSRAEQLLQQRESWDHERKLLMSKLEAAQQDLDTRTDEKNLLQLRHDALGDESASLQRDMARLQKQVDELEFSLDQEKAHGLQIERDMNRKHQAEVDRLNDDIADLQDEIQRVRDEASGGQSASASLEREVSRLQKRISELETSLSQEKARALQNLYEANTKHKEEVDRLNNNIADLQDEITRVRREAAGGQSASASLEREMERLQKRVKELETNLDHEKANTRVRQSTSGDESTSLQREITRLRSQVGDLELNLDQERSHGRQIERDVRNQLKSEIDRLNDDISQLHAAIREKDNLYNNDSEKWEAERRNLEAQRDRLEERAAGLERTIDRLRDAEGTLSSKEMKLQDALNSEAQRHKNEEAALSRQIDDLRQDLETRQSSLTALRNEVAAVREDLRQSQLDYQAQAEKVEALEDEVEVLQATLDEESEDAAQKLNEADQVCQDLRRQLELARRNQSERAEDLGEQLEEANRISEDLSQQLQDANRKLRDVERQCERLKQQAERATRHESKQSDQKVEQANRVAEGLRRDLNRATRESEKANRLCEELREQLELAKQDLDYASPLCKELRQKLDRARNERAAYKASAEKLQADCERLQEGAKEALAWIEAKNSEPNSSSISYTPHINKRGTKASFRYGDIVMDVVDQRDHEAVIRAADAAEKRHTKEIRGLALQMQWMQARWEREAKLRNDAAFAKKFLALQLEISEACNKADLRILRNIHKQLGIKSPDALLSSRKREQSAKKEPSKLKVFASVFRAVARMRIGAKQWGQHEQTRKKLINAWEESKRREEEEVELI